MSLVYEDDQEDGMGDEEERLSPVEAKRRFLDFIRNFRTGAQVFPYREMLVERYRRREGTLTVDLSDLNQYDPLLLHVIQSRPGEQLKVFESAAVEALESLLSLGGGGNDDEGDERVDVQILLESTQLPIEIRALAADHVNQLLKVSGIVVSVSKVKFRFVTASAACCNCGHRKTVSVQGAFGTISMPSKCDNGFRIDRKGEKKACPPDPYVVLGDYSEFVDQQTLKLQELPEAVPTGELPRSILCVCDRKLVDLVAPGARISVVGVSSLFESKEQNKSSSSAKGGGPSLRTPYLRVVGMDFDLTEGGRGAVGAARFTPAEEERFVALAARPDVYELVSRSIAPSISGDYTRDIKRAIACLLFGGSSKDLDDGAKLRGDINVLLLGDPSTAKSQFLKFAEKVAPVGVYTSGKGSSAAGLTASVVRGANQEFHLEGGAMVLADGGVCCIDEFDKMRETDRVAIHEAMEQQTISIAKAGICTVLNSRTSVLAAANPVFGRYDDLKSASENIDMMSTILSRFDMIFIVRDVRDETRDIAIAKHVMGVHITSGLLVNNKRELHGSSTAAAVNLSAASASGKRRKKQQHDQQNTMQRSSPDALVADVLDPPTLKRYIQYCRSKCKPRLNKDTASILKSEYVGMRQSNKDQAEEVGGRKNQAIPITVRQLEAMIRISESVAKMRLQDEVQPSDVQEALRLFKISTLAAAQTRAQSTGGANDLLFLGDDARKSVQNAETFLKQRLPPGTACTKLKLIEEGIALGHTDFGMRRAIDVMTKRLELSELDRGKKLRRVK